MWTGLILSPVISEFGLGGRGPFLSLAVNIGLLVGAVFWGVGCDVWGRRSALSHSRSLGPNGGADVIPRWSFNLTLLVTGVFGLAAGGAHDFVTLAALVAVLGIGVGGNMPVDSAVFLGQPHIHRFSSYTR